MGKGSLLLITAILLTTIPVQSFAQNKEVLTNKTIVQLHKAGLGNNLVKEKINQAECWFDLTTDGLIELKKAGVPDEVINAMFAKTSASSLENQNPTSTPIVIVDNSNLQSGIYYRENVTNKFIEIEASPLTNSKSGGIGEALQRKLVSGLINAKVKASLSDSMAQLRIKEHSPVFVFVFNGSSQSLNDGSTYFSNAQSPKDFFLVKMHRVKNTREIVVGKYNNVGRDIGVDDKSKVNFTVQKVQKGIYQVTPTEPFDPGEYCFMYSSTSMQGGIATKIYDFNIQ